MFNLWRDWFIDPKSGLPWGVVFFCPWLQMDNWFELTNIPLESCDSNENEISKTYHETKSKVSLEELSSQASKRKTSLPIVSEEKTSRGLQNHDETQSLSTVASKNTKSTKKVATVEENIVVTVAKGKTTLPEKETTSEKIKQIEKNTPNKEPKPAPLKAVGEKSTVNTIADKKSANALSVSKKNNVTVSNKLSVQAQNKITQISPASSKEQIREAILLLCGAQEWIDGATLASKLRHSLNQLETLHLVPMLRNGQLKSRYNDDTQPQEYCLA